MRFPVKEIGAFEAKNRLGTLLDWVECRAASPKQVTS